MGNSQQKLSPNTQNDLLSSLSGSENESLTKFFGQVQCLLKNSDKDEGQAGLVRLFKSPYMVELLLKERLMSSFEVFLSFVVSATRINDTKTIQTFWELIPNDNRRLHNFFRILFEIDGHEFEQSAGVISKLSTSVENFSKKSRGGESVNHSIDFHSFLSWTHSFGSNVSKQLQTYLNYLCFRDISLPSFSPFLSPHLQNDSDILSVVDLFPLALYDKSMQGNWAKLYTSTSDGLSFNRIAHHILGYDGPTCIIVRCMNPGRPVIGVFCEERWKDTNRFFGSSRTCLFTLEPVFQVIRSKDHSDGNYQYLNSRTYGFPHGLGVGGTLERFRFFIPDSLEQCTARSNCLTFEPGRLLITKSPSDIDLSATKITENTESVFQPSHRSASFSASYEQETFEIDTLEIWACGGEELVKRGLKAQELDRQVRAENIERAKKVDKAAFFENKFDQEFFLGKTLGHREHVSSRHDT